MFKYALGTIVVLSTSREAFLEKKKADADLEMQKQLEFNRETDRLINEARRRILWERAGVDRPDSPGEERARIPVLSPDDGILLHSYIGLVEQGEIIGRQELANGTPDGYLVRYRTGCGCHAEVWFEEGAIFDPETYFDPETEFAEVDEKATDSEG